MANLNYLSITEAHKMLVEGKVTATELVQYYLDRIQKYDESLGCVLTLCQEEALLKAKQADEKLARNQEIGLLEGIPYTAKDMFLVEGIRTTAASEILDNFIAPYSSTAIQKLDAAGAILIAKVNQDEFAHGGSTENSAFYKTKNPWDASRVPGGSSGGSAVAVAADFGIFSLGTDTGGSIRQPASYCGVTGLKPSYGMVSRYGVVAMGSSFDCVGPITRSAEDADIVMSVISGLDGMDSTTVAYSSKSDSNGQSGFKLGLSKEALENTNILKVVKLLETKGHELIEGIGGNSESSNIDSIALAAYYILVPSEISSNLERYDGIKYGSKSAKVANLLETYSKTRDEFFGPEVKRRNIIGTYSLSAGYYDAYYKKAMQARTIIRNYYDEMFKQVDMIITPTTLEPAFKMGTKSDPIEMYKTDILTVSANLAGVPAISIPCGIDDSTKMPMGMQIIGRQGDDVKVLELAKAIQSLTNDHKKVEELVL